MRRAASLSWAPWWTWPFTQSELHGPMDWASLGCCGAACKWCSLKSCMQQGKVQAPTCGQCKRQTAAKAVQRC